MKINTVLSALNLDKNIMLTQNLSGEVIAINQNQKFESIEYLTDSKANYSIYNFKQKGIGKSRNKGILLSSCDIVVIADDDEKFYDDYLNIIEKAYTNFPDYDVILFNVKNGDQKDKINEITKVNLINCYKYGAVNFSFKLESIRKKDIYFSNNFGGGAPHGSGEDSKFLVDCLKNNLKVIAIPITIAQLDTESESTWFKGYNEKFFFDKGALFSSYNLNTGKILGLLVLIKSFRNKGKLRLFEKIIYFIKGYNYYKK